jgi:hypothetical protein
MQCLEVFANNLEGGILVEWDVNLSIVPYIQEQSGGIWKYSQGLETDDSVHTHAGKSGYTDFKAYCPISIPTYDQRQSQYMSILGTAY